MTRTTLRAAIALVAGLAFAPPAAAQTWTGFVGTNWNTGTNWTAGGPPNSPAATASFTGNALGVVNISGNVAAFVPRRTRVVSKSASLTSVRTRASETPS